MWPDESLQDTDYEFLNETAETGHPTVKFAVGKPQAHIFSYEHSIKNYHMWENPDVKDSDQDKPTLKKKFKKPQQIFKRKKLKKKITYE